MADLVEDVETMNRVVELYIKGHNPTQIMRELKITRNAVLSYIEQWKQWIQKDQDVTKRARETLQIVDEHYAMIIREHWNTIRDADIAGNLAVKATLLKNVASLEETRAKLFHQVGLDDQHGLADDLAETQRRQELLMKILREVTADCSRCKFEVRTRLSEVNKQQEIVEVTQPAISG